MSHGKVGLKLGIDIDCFVGEKKEDNLLELRRKRDHAIHTPIFTFCTSLVFLL